MRINEVERLVGVTKKNIRFYEAEGLLAPRRSSENGYRDYAEADVETLRQIKLLRKLGVPIEEIRRLQSGRLTVADAMRRHQVTIDRDVENLTKARAVCGWRRPAPRWTSWTRRRSWIGWKKWNRRERRLWTDRSTMCAGVTPRR